VTSYIQDVGRFIEANQAGSVPSRLYRGALGELAVVAQMNAEIDALAERARTVGFLDSLIGGIEAVGGAIGAIVPTIGTVVGAVQATQCVINGRNCPTQAAPPMTPAQAAQMMAAGGGAATQGSAEQAAFAQACRADPACTAAIWAALQGGGMTPGMMNGSSGGMDVTEASLIAAGVPAALVMALRGGGQAALNALRGLLPGVALGVGAAVGTEAITGLLPSAAASKFPRSIFIPDPKTGGQREYKYRGRPVLYSGDIAATRRVVKVAKRARAARGGARRQSRAMQIMMLPAGAATACGKCGNGACSGC
jgi:hypothetical protein